jgi:hypothetical protein
MDNLSNRIKQLFLIATLLLIPCVAFALETIYLKNGSVIKGTIVEHNIADKKYTIQTSDGSIFVYTADKITKITKEAAVTTEKPQASVVINNTNTNNTQDTVTNNNVAVVATLEQPERKKWKLFARTAKIVVKTQQQPVCLAIWPQPKGCSAYYPIEENYSGSGGGLSYALNNYIVLRLSKISTEHEDYSYLSYDATIADLLLATNTQLTGWNWYLGLSRINQELNNTDNAYTGLTLGVEYNFEDIFIGLTGTAFTTDDNSTDHDAEPNMTAIGGLHLGIRF